MIKSLKDARITDGLPRIVSGQDWVIALSGALGLLHEKTLEYADASQIYTALDTVSEDILDTLAVNWKIDWYDTGFTVDQKRRIVLACFEARRLMGTVRAVKLQAQAIYPGTEIKEWFDIGSEPGTFDTELAVLPTDADIAQFVKAVNYTKNVRSHWRRIAVILSGELDGGDLLEGRTGKNPLGIETHYYLTYTGHFSHVGLERMILGNIRFKMDMPFWGNVIYNGAILYDGSTDYNSRRRYNLAFGIKENAGAIHTESDLKLYKVRTRAEWTNRQRLKSAQKFSAAIDFWRLVHYTGSVLYDGSQEYCQRRGRLRTALKLTAKSSHAEEIGEATVLTKTHNQYYYDSTYSYDGSAQYKTIYEKEVVS